MKALIMRPAGWPCSLAECRPGHFVFDGKHLGFKTEYRTSEGRIEAYNEAGEFFVGGAKDEIERRRITVQPVDPVWVEEEL